MAYELIRPGHQQSIEAATQILPRQAVTLVGTNRIMAAPAASMNLRPHGVNGVATQGNASSVRGPVFGVDEKFTVYEELNIVKAKAGASLGAGAEVAVGSNNGTFWPVAAASLFAASGHWTVGVAMTPAAADEVFSLYVKPRKV